MLDTRISVIVLYNSTFDLGEAPEMIKSLNMLIYTPRFAAPGVGTNGPNPNETRIPRLAFGFVGAALAVATIAIAVILPAQVDSRGHQSPLQLASQAIPAASVDAGAITITVVAAREPRASTRPAQIIDAAASPGPSGETTSSPILRISTAAR